MEILNKPPTEKLRECKLSCALGYLANAPLGVKNRECVISTAGCLN